MKSFLVLVGLLSLGACASETGTQLASTASGDKACGTGMAESVACGLGADGKSDVTGDHLQWLSSLKRPGGEAADLYYDRDTHATVVLAKDAN